MDRERLSYKSLEVAAGTSGSARCRTALPSLPQPRQLHLERKQRSMKAWQGARRMRPCRLLHLRRRALHHLLRGQEAESFLFRAQRAADGGGCGICASPPPLEPNQCLPRVRARACLGGSTRHLRHLAVGVSTRDFTG